jgi:branched-chain amino acid transport system substrate-binding protein
MPGRQPHLTRRREPARRPQGGTTMTHRALLAGAAALAILAAAPAAAQELRVGFLNTMTGPGALPGVEQTNAWKLGLEHEGWTKDGDKLGGVPTRIWLGDDQQKPDVALKEVEKFLVQHKVHVVAGFMWSNVLMAAHKPIVDAKTTVLITNAGASPLAGPLCSPYIVSTSFNNEQFTEALGKLISDEKVESIYLMAPNFQAGKDQITGIKRTLKGPKVVGESYFKFNETDYQADITAVRAAKPKALFAFAPGGMAGAFMKQWAASGAGKEIKLYTSNTVDWLTLPAIGEAAIGSFHALHWNTDLKNPANEKFVKDYVAKHKQKPSNYAAQGYDGARLLAAAMRATGGKFADGLELTKILRKQKYDSVRGPYTSNVNGMPIQNFYLQEVVKGADGRPDIVTRSVIFANYKDAYWEQCPADRRH